MVFTQQIEVPPEPELGPGWRKVEVRRDNRVVKTLTKYWNPQGEELLYKDVKKMLDSVQGKTKRKSSELQSPPKKTKLAPNESNKKKIASMMTKELAAERIPRKCEKHELVFKSENERVNHLEEFHKKKVPLDGNRTKTPNDDVKTERKKKLREPVPDENIQAEDMRPVNQHGKPSAQPVLQQDEVQARYSHLVVTKVPPTAPPGPAVPGQRSSSKPPSQSSKPPPPGPPPPPKSAPPPGPADLAIVRCQECEFTTKSRKKLKVHMETHQLADVSVNEAEEDLGNLSIDNMFESFNDDLNLARVVEVEDEIDGDDVKEVGVLLSKQRLGKSFNDSEEDEEGVRVEDMRSPEEITLASEPEEEPEEITLDEGDEEEEEGPLPSKKMSIEDKEKAEEEELAKLEEMDSLLGKSEFVAQMTENNNMLAKFTSNCWFSAPPQWKTSKQGVWYGTVDQIEELYGVEQVSVNMEGVKNQEQFMQRVRPLLQEHNQVSWGPALYMLAKALWFKSLEPDIGPSQAEVVEEEEYDEYDESIHYEEEVEVEERGDSELAGERRREEDTPLEELDDEGVTQAAEEYDYEADEEGEEWEEGDDEGDYEDYEESAQDEYGKAYNQGYYGANQGRYYQEANQTAYFTQSGQYGRGYSLHENVS